MEKYFLPVVLLLGTTATTIKSMQKQTPKEVSHELVYWENQINSINKLEAKLYSLEGYIRLLEKVQNTKKKFGKTQINRRPNQQRLHALSEKQGTIKALENLKEKFRKQLSNPETTAPQKTDVCLCNSPILLMTNRRQTIACIPLPTPTVATKKNRYTIPVIGKVFTALFKKKKGTKGDKKL